MVHSARPARWSIQCATNAERIREIGRLSTAWSVTREPVEVEAGIKVLELLR